MKLLMKKHITIIMGLTLIICQSYADTIIYKINNSQNMIISNIQVTNSDSQFVYFKNKHSLNTNKLLCSQITMVTNDSGDEIQTSCSNKTNIINEKQIHEIQHKNKLLNKKITKEKPQKKLNIVKESIISNEEKNEIIPEKNNLNNFLLISLIMALIIISIKKKS